jgi:hypothetical protein
MAGSLLHRTIWKSEKEVGDCHGDFFVVSGNTVIQQLAEILFGLFRNFEI